MKTRLYTLLELLVAKPAEAPACRSYPSEDTARSPAGCRAKAKAKAKAKARATAIKFTLTELLVVIGIVTVLAAMLVPVLAKAREKARRVNCAGNLKCMGLAMLMYSGENSGYFMITPPGNNFEPLNTGSILNDGKIYGCPSATVLATVASRSNYRYVGSGLSDSEPLAPIARVAYDTSGNHPDNRWMNCLFVDGHVEGAKPDDSKDWNTYP